MEKRCVKSAPAVEDPGRVLFETEDQLPVNFDLLESADASVLVAVAHGNSLHLVLFPDGRTRSEPKTLSLANAQDPAYRDVLLVVRFGAGEEGELLGAAGELGLIYLLSLAAPGAAPPRVLQHHLKTVMDLRFVPQQRLVSASQDHSVALWDLRGGAVLCKWVDTAGRLSAANQALPCATAGFLLAGYDDAAVRLLDVEREEIALVAEVIDANICAMELAGNLLFARSVTGRLVAVAVDVPARSLVVLKCFHLDVAAFSYFDALTLCRGRFLLAGCGDSQWAVVALDGELEVAHRAVCPGLRKVKRAAAAEGAALAVFCDEQKVVFDCLTRDHFWM